MKRGVSTWFTGLGADDGKNFAGNCMKMKEIGSHAKRPLPLSHWIRHWFRRWPRCTERSKFGNRSWTHHIPKRHSPFTAKYGTFIATCNKKAFQLKANRPLYDSPCLTVNKCERVWGLGPRSEQGPLSKQTQHTDMTENITLPQLRWRTVKTTNIPQNRGFILSQRSQRSRFTGVVSS